MIQDELTQIVTKSIEDMGFARIKRAALVDVFDSGTADVSNTQIQLENFAKSNGLEFKSEDVDFVVFYQTGTEPPQIPS
jgi:hypothetical protein